MTDNELQRFAQMIYQGIYQDFAIRHLSGNLMGTMRIEAGPNEVRISVPAVRYDWKSWNKEKSIVYRPELGSYAEAVDVYGGFSKTHQNYADRAIFAAIRTAMGERGEEWSIQIY